MSDQISHKSAQDYRRAYAQQQVVRSDFTLSDEAYFRGGGAVRLRPPLSSETTPAVRSVREIGFTPMLIVTRSGEAAPRPIALIAFEQEALESVVARLARMGDTDILELLRGSPKTLFQLPLRWWPL